MTIEEFIELVHLLLICGINDKSALESGNLTNEEWLRMMGLIDKYQSEKPGPEADPKSGDLISRENLREQIDDCEYFNSSFQKMTVAEFLTIVHDIINDAPTVETKTISDCVVAYGDGFETARRLYERPHTIDNCDMNVFEPEKMIQTPSCLTNPERHEELLERYKEGEYGER